MAGKGYTKRELMEKARSIALEYGLPPEVFVNQIRVESGFNPRAYNKRSGAYGLGQIIYKVNPKYKRTDDPIEQLRQSADKMSTLKKRYRGNTALSLAAYNYGDGNAAKAALDFLGVPYKDGRDAVRKLLRGGYIEKLPDGPELAVALGGQLPKETRDYIRKIITNRSVLYSPKQKDAGAVNRASEAVRSTPAVSSVLSEYNGAITSKMFSGDLSEELVKYLDEAEAQGVKVFDNGEQPSEAIPSGVNDSGFARQ